MPPEAEWEKAARGGLQGHFYPWESYSQTRADYPDHINGTRANFNDYETHARTAPVGIFDPNGYGLYDMAGNVREWYWDWYDSYPDPAQTRIDPPGPEEGFWRVERGGGWSSSSNSLLVNERGLRSPGSSGFLIREIGFRTVRDAGE